VPKFRSLTIGKAGCRLDTALGLVLLASDALRVDPEQNLDAVPSPLGDLWGWHSGTGLTDSQADSPGLGQAPHCGICSRIREWNFGAAGQAGQLPEALVILGLILGLAGAAIGAVIFYSLVEHAVWSGVGRALRDHDEWQRAGDGGV